MLDFLQSCLQTRRETSGQLTIDRRVLITPRSTIGIASISAVSSGTVRVPRGPVRGLAFALLALGLVLLVVGMSQGSVLAAALGGSGFLVGLVLTRFTASDMPCLSVATRGGDIFLFTGQRKTLEEGRRLLTEKINTGDESAAYRIHFEKGIVQPLSHAEPVASIFADTERPPALGNGRIGAVAAPLPPPGPSPANGYHMALSAPHVDYTPVLGQIVDMQRFYAQRSDTQDIADRLSEMEYLMRSGTPTAAGRHRLDLLASELSAILAAYPNVVQVFHHAAHLAAA
jgi:hypothetical protein